MPKKKKKKNGEKKPIVSGENEDSRSEKTDGKKKKQTKNKKKTNARIGTGGRSSVKRKESKSTKKNEENTNSKSGESEISSTYAEFPDHIIKLIQEHNKIARKEDVTAFKGIRWFDQVWEIKDSSVLEKITKCLSRAKRRQLAFRKAVRTTWDDKTKSQAMQAKQFETTMLLHFPEQFQNPEIDFTVRVTNIKAAKKLRQHSREVHIDRLIKGGGGVGNNNIIKEKKAFQDGISFVYDLKSAKDIELADPFFSKPEKALGPGMPLYEGMMDATRAVIARAYEILDYGGVPYQVEEALKHLPPGFWPPMLVEDLQAWRHCERELIWEKINPEVLQVDLGKTADSMTDQLVKKKGVKVTAADMKAVLGTIGDITALLGASGKVAKAFSKVEVKVVNTFLKQLKHSAVIMARVEKRSKSIDKAGRPESLKSPDMRPEDKALVVAEISHMISAFSAVKSIANVSPAGKAFVEQVCPGLAIFGCALETAVFAKAAYDCNKERKEVKKELAVLDEIQGFRKNAMHYAFVNEVESRSRQTTEKTIHAVGRATITVGAVATVAGGVSGLAVKTTGKAIEVGNKIAFVAVDWKKAKKAMKTIDEARAGNYKARVKVFKESNLYAKQYIAIMAKKGDKIALDYLQVRGLTEVDFSGPISTKILRQAMLKKAGQHDEYEDTNFMHSLAGKFLGPSLKKGLRKKKKQSTKDKGKKNAVNKSTENSLKNTKKE